MPLNFVTIIKMKNKKLAPAHARTQQTASRCIFLSNSNSFDLVFIWFLFSVSFIDFCGCLELRLNCKPNLLREQWLTQEGNLVWMRHSFCDAVAKRFSFVTEKKMRSLSIADKFGAAVMLSFGFIVVVNRPRRWTVRFSTSSFGHDQFRSLFETSTYWWVVVINSFYIFFGGNFLSRWTRSIHFLSLLFVCFIFISNTSRSIYLSTNSIVFESTAVACMCLCVCVRVWIINDHFIDIFYAVVFVFDSQRVFNHLPHTVCVRADVYTVL